MTAGGSTPAAARVLVVDDYGPNLTALEALLSPIARVTTAPSGARGLEAIARDDYAVVVLDIQMPVMDGFEVAKRIRAGTRNAQVPIIFLTAMDGGAAPVLEGYAAGAVDYLRRPVEPVILRCKVSIFVELHLSRERAQQEAAARARLEAEHAAAQQASREKDRFLGMLSHELRTPLTTILLWSEVMLNRELPPATVRRGLDAVDVCARREARIVDNVLAMTRFMAGKASLSPASFELPALVTEVVAELRRMAAERQVAVSFQAPAGGGQTVADRMRLRQALVNLLENAVKFTPAGGRVDVVLEETPAAVRLQIKDTGIGFPAGLGPNLFTRYDPGRPVSIPGQGGLGLGLPVAKEVIDLHGGTINADSEGSGRGASFTDTLPRRAIHEQGTPPVEDVAC